MVKYNVEVVAEELMLTISELRGVLDLYFDEAAELSAACDIAVGKQDYSAVAQIMHGLKGSSLNLRMEKIAKIAAEVENFAKAGGGPEMVPTLTRIQAEISVIKGQVYAFYGAVNT